MSFDFGKGTSSSSSSSSSNSTINGTQNQNSSSTQTPIAPDFYLPYMMANQPGANGMYGPQQGAVDWASRMLNGGDPAGLSRPQGTLDNVGNYFQDTLNNRPAPTLRNLEAIDPRAYATPGAVTAQQVASQTGASFMDAYKNPYMRDVVDSSLSQYDQDSAEARNSLRANNAGAFGNKRYGVAEGQFAADSALGRAGLGANLRSNAFNTAAGYGMQDATRDLSAQGMNATNKLAADTFNNNQQQARNMFDANLGMQYNQQRDDVARSLGLTAVAQGDMGLRGLDAMRGLNQDVFNAGSTGYGQILNWLAQSRPLFGQQNDGTSNTVTSGTQSGTQTGTQRGRTTNMGLGFDISPFSIFSPGG